MTRVVILFFFVLLTLGAAYYLVVERHPAQSGPAHLLLGGLSADSISLTRITIENSDGVLFQAKREGEQWLATHLDTVMTFPADVTQLADFVSALTNARIIEPKTARASQYSLLGVEPVTQPGAQSTLITLATDTQQWRVVIGNLASSGMGRYVREPSQQQSYLIDESLNLPLTQYEWLESDVIDGGLNELNRVVIDNDPGFTLTKDGAGEWQLDGIEQPLAYPGILNHILNDIVNFEYDSIVPLITPPDNENRLRTIEITTNEGNKLIFSVYQASEESEGYWLTATGDLVSPSVTEWIFHLTNFQARGMLSAKEDLLQQAETM